MLRDAKAERGSHYQRFTNARYHLTILLPPERENLARKTDHAIAETDPWFFVRLVRQRVGAIEHSTLKNTRGNHFCVTVFLYERIDFENARARESASDVSTSGCRVNECKVNRREMILLDINYIFCLHVNIKYFSVDFSRVVALKNTTFSYFTFQAFKGSY